MQIIHPIAFSDPNIRKQDKCFWGDMTKVPVTRLEYEDDLFPTAISMISELLRKDSNYNKDRKCCVDIVIFVLSILFAFVIGLIIGAVTGIFAALGLGAFVAIAILLGILILVRIIMLICCKKCC